LPITKATVGVGIFLVSSFLLSINLPTDSARAGSRPRYRFRNVTQSVGLRTEPSPSWGSSWGDFDGDADVDLFENRHGRTPRLWRNMDASFALSQNTVFSPIDRHGCAWGEANGDGRPDLYCTQGADRGRGSGPNQLFLQKADGGFVDRARALGVKNRLGRGRTVNWLDFDRDGDLDIFVGNEMRKNHGNVMFRNVGSGFRKASVGVSERLPTVGSSWADWDGDRDADLLVLLHPRRHRPPLAYENVDGKFRRVRLRKVMRHAWRSAAWGDFDADGWPDLHLVNDNWSLVLHNVRGRLRVAHRRRIRNGRMSAWFDVENDGDLDLFLVRGSSGTGPRAAINRGDFLINRRRGRFSKIRHWSFRGPRIGNGDAVSIADYDADGRQDVFVTNGATSGFGEGEFRAGPSVLLKNRSLAGNSITLKLTGSSRNPWGLGARITVSTPTRSYRAQVTDGFNYRAQSDVSLLHFGIGGRTRARLRVRWQRRSDCLSVAANSVVRLRKGSSPC